MLKTQEQDASWEQMIDGLIDLSGLTAWRENPDKYAVLELVSQGVETKKIMETLKLTEDELDVLYPTDEELDAYHPIFEEKGPSEEQLEEAYQKRLLKVHD